MYVQYVGQNFVSHQLLPHIDHISSLVREGEVSWSQWIRGIASDYYYTESMYIIHHIVCHVRVDDEYNSSNILYFLGRFRVAYIRFTLISCGLGLYNLLT